MKTLCIDCGDQYEYDPSKPLGASSSRCCKCRKKDSNKNKKIELLNIAGNGSMKCRKCGYGRSVHALLLIDSVGQLISTPEDTEQRKAKAKTQYILCLNCNEEIRSNEVEVRVVKSKSYPVEVEFYLLEVRIVRTKIEPSVEYHSDYEQAEIVSDGGGSARTVVDKKKRINQ